MSDATILTTQERDFIERVRTMEQEARFPELLTARDALTSAVWSRTGRASGLTTLILPHTGLSASQQAQLAEFRLRQFLLCDWYEPERVLADGLREDPTFYELPPQTYHVVVGDGDGRLLAYTCLQSAGTALHAPDMRDETVTLATPGRPLFPTERELFGPDIFLTIPVMRAIPLARMFEGVCSFYNAAFASRLAIQSWYESFCAPLLYALDPAHGIDIILGHSNQLTRAIYTRLAIPSLHAPHVPVSPPVEDGYWAEQVNEQGAFLPMVLALADLREHSAHLLRAHAAFDRPLSEVSSTLYAAFASATPPPTFLLSDLPSNTAGLESALTQWEANA